MRARIVVVVVSLALLQGSASAQPFVCGGHLIRDSGRVNLDAPRAGPQSLQPRPAWMGARDRELWDQLVYNAHDNFKTNAGPLEKRRTFVVRATVVPTITVCMESADQTYAGERLAPYANERWWRENIARWTGLGWRGELQIGRDCDIRLWRKIEVREARPGEMVGKTIARADSARMGGRWMRTEILWNPDALKNIDDWQASWALTHELGHALGMWHVEPGTGFVMERYNPGASRAMPVKERELAQLAYEVGPGARYPGLEEGEPVPVLPLVGVVVLAALLMISRARIAAAVVVLLAVLPGQLHAQDSPGRNLLAPLAQANCKGFDVDVDGFLDCFDLFNMCEPMNLIVEQMPADAMEIGLTKERVRTVAESRLRAARLYDAEARPYLYVNVGVVGLAFSHQVEFKKRMLEPKLDAFGMSTTWQYSGTGTHGNDASFIVQHISEHLDRFVLEYLRVNENACE